MFIDLDLEPAQALAAEIAEELSRSPITREFQFAVGETGGSISGVVAPAAEAEARNLLEHLKQMHGQRMPLTFDVKGDPKLNFSLVGLTLGGEAASATLVQRGRAETFRVGEMVFGNELFIPMSSR